MGLMASTRFVLLAAVAQALINTLLALPGLLVALVVITLLGRGIAPLIVALGLAQIAPIAFSTRAAVKTVRSAAYIEAAINLGATEVHLLIEHLWPNVQPTIVSYLAVVFSYTLINAAALGFLGLGGALGTPEWGIMLAEGRAAFRAAPWISIGPGIMLSLTVWSVNDLADRLIQRPA
jgi:ABC-type dipeptide/oligopeptide/nickel transport system permease subunit